MPKPLSIKSLPPEDRPRERLFRDGAESLSVQELLAVILGRGSAAKPVLAQAREILAEFPTLTVLAESSPEQIMKLGGLGMAKACQLLACFELANRWQLEQSRTTLAESKPLALVSPQYVAAVARSKVRDANKEHCIVLSFDVRNKLVAADRLSVGILNANLVHPRETFALGIKRHAASLMLAHNHPSGDLEPSADDLDITARLSSAGRIMGIELADHIIFSRSGYLSFKERQLL
jgi:DNA repair protein RadC